MSKRLVVLVSGGGTNLQAVLDACVDGGLSAGAMQAKVVAVVSNNADAYGLERARLAGVPAVVLGSKGRERASFDHLLAGVVGSYQPDLVVLAGWMRILTVTFLSEFRVLNLHPALPGMFPGTRAIERAFEAWQNAGGEGPFGSSEGMAGSGVMVHWVLDEGVDNGPVVVQASVPFRDGDTLDRFGERIHSVEHELLVRGIGLALTSLETQ